MRGIMKEKKIKDNSLLAKVVVILIIAAVVITYSISFISYLF